MTYRTCLGLGRGRGRAAASPRTWSSSSPSWRCSAAAASASSAPSAGGPPRARPPRCRRSWRCRVCARWPWSSPAIFLDRGHGVSGGSGTRHSGCGTWLDFHADKKVFIVKFQLSFHQNPPMRVNVSSSHTWKSYFSRISRHDKNHCDCLQFSSLQLSILQLKSRNYVYDFLCHYRNLRSKAKTMRHAIFI